MTILGGHARGDRLVWSGGLVETLAEFGFSPGASRIALGRLVRRGWLARVREGRFIHYRLTDAGERVMREGDRRIFSFGRTRPRSDTWTVVWHAIPADQGLARARLARRLRFLGFGPLQDGTWVAPHETEETIAGLLAELGVAEHCIVLTARPSRPQDLDLLVRRAWNLQDLARRYGEFTAAVPFLLEPAPGDREAFLGRTLMIDIFRQFPAEDPELPDGLMGIGEARETARDLFHRVFAELGPAAQRHFDSVTRSPRGSRPAAAADGRSQEVVLCRAHGS